MAYPQSRPVVGVVKMKQLLGLRLRALGAQAKATGLL